MSDLSLEDQNFVEKQTELIAEHNAPDNFEGSVILEVRPAFRDEDHFAPLQALTAIQAFGANNTTTQDGGIGVLGIGSQSQNAIGVKGIGLTGVRGESAQPSDAHGVIGVVRGNAIVPPFLPSSGVLGQGFGPDVPGVRGEGESAAGVEGQSNKSPGVQGRSNTGHGVFGMSEHGFGVVAHSTNGYGLYASSDIDHAVYGDNLNAHVTVLKGTFGRTSGCYGVTLNNRGVSGVVGSEDWAKNKPETMDDYAIGVFGEAGLFSGQERRLTAKGFAGVFLGPVVTWGPFVNYGGPKSAAVLHPDGSHRLLYCLESPESWFEDFGEAKLVNGKAAVKIDKDFAGVAKTDAYHVFLSPYGDSNGLYVSRRNRNGFEVREHGGGQNNLSFSYRVVARRKDVPSERLPRFDAPPEIVKALAKQKSKVIKK